MSARQALIAALVLLVAWCSPTFCAARLSVLDTARLPRRGFPPTIAVGSNSSSAELLDRGELDLIFVKNFKCSSSTVSGIVRNIGDRRGYHATRNRWNFRHEPGVWADHTPAIQLGPRLARLKLVDYFLLSFVRDPLQKCLSFFYMSNNERLASGDWAPEEIDAALIARLSEMCTGAQKRYLNMFFAADGKDITTREQVDTLLGAYNFVGVTERFDESVVVLKHLLGLSHWDIVYISAKIAGDPVMRKGFAERPRQEDRPAVKAYIEHEWQTDNVLEYYLVERANRLLDQLIASIPGFAVDLDVFKELEKRVYSECYGQINGTANCLHRDNGCGIDCFDRLEQQLTGSAPHRPVKQIDTARRQRRTIIHTALVATSFILLSFIFLYDYLRTVPIVRSLL